MKYYALVTTPEFYNTKYRGLRIMVILNVEERWGQLCDYIAVKSEISCTRTLAEQNIDYAREIFIDVIVRDGV
jgi:hypothetical protein